MSKATKMIIAIIIAFIFGFGFYMISPEAYKKFFPVIVVVVFFIGQWVFNGKKKE